MAGSNFGSCFQHCAYIESLFNQGRAVLGAGSLVMNLVLLLWTDIIWAHLPVRVLGEAG